MDVTVVVQARMGSSRLPGKVLRPLAGHPMLALMLQRLGPVHARHLVVATSDLERDDPIADLVASVGVPCVRGSEADVLGRFMTALHSFPASHVVRLTADCPLIDPVLVDAVVGTHLHRDADYTSNTLLRTYPDGLDVEVIAAEALETASALAIEADEREHVTPFVLRRPQDYHLVAHLGDRDLEDERWTVDTAADFDFLNEVLTDWPALVSAGWLEIHERVGERNAPDPATTVLRVDRRGAIEPGARRWLIRRDNTTLGAIRMPVSNGVGHLELIEGDPELLEQAEFRAALSTRLRADIQVRSIRINRNPNKDGSHGRNLVLPR